MRKTFTTSRGNITIRDATPADALPYRELRLEALQGSPTAFTADYERTLNQPAEYWEERLTMDADEANLFFAEHEGHLLGMSGIARGGSPKTRHGAWIWGVYITPAWRGLRIAEAIIDACITWAKTRGIIIVKLGVSANNGAAIRCYERCGFRTYGTEPRAIFYEGSYYDEFLMSRSLDDSTTYTPEQ